MPGAIHLPRALSLRPFRLHNLLKTSTDLSSVGGALHGALSLRS